MYYNEISLSLCSDRISAKVPVARLVKLNWIFCNTCPSSEFQTEKWKCESRSPESLIITESGTFLNHVFQITRCCQIFIILTREDSPIRIVCFLYFRAGLFANHRQLANWSTLANSWPGQGQFSLNDWETGTGLNSWSGRGGQEPTNRDRLTARRHRFPLPQVVKDDYTELALFIGILVVVCWHFVKHGLSNFNIIAKTTESNEHFPWNRK